MTVHCLTYTVDTCTPLFDVTNWIQRRECKRSRTNPGHLVQSRIPYPPFLSASLGCWVELCNNFTFYWAGCVIVGERISWGSRSWPLTHWETGSYTPSSRRGTYMYWRERTHYLLAMDCLLYNDFTITSCKPRQFSPAATLASRQDKMLHCFSPLLLVGNWAFN